MPVDINNAQDVFKDIGKSVNFTVLKLRRQDREADLEAVREVAGRIPAIVQSMNLRAEDGGLKVAFGISHQGWTYLFPEAKMPKELEPFTGIKGDTFEAPATEADLFLHVRSNEEAVTYMVVDQIMGFLRDVVDVVDETHGFRYMQGRAIIDFIDGTENPVNEEAIEWAIVGDEDPDFIDGSYAFAQKYVHDMDGWRNLTTEMQERIIGRGKYSDLELDDDAKDERAHTVIAQDNRDDVEHKIVRMNVAYSQPGRGVTGTYFIGYARYWDVTRQMLTNMFTQNDRLLEFSTATTGQLFFIPSKSLLDEIAEGEF